MIKYHIQTVELASAQKAIQFNLIPQEYNDLFIVISGRSDRTSDARDELFIQFNGETSGYSSRAVRGSGTSADGVTSTAAGITRINLPSATTTSNTFGNGSVYIPNYNLNTPKPINVDNVMENNSAFSFQEIVAGLWNNTSPITRITVFPEVGNFTAGSSISLYGVRRGDDRVTKVAPVAVGGTVTTSGGYTIHTFNSSGTLAVNKDVEVEYLVVAGGGGGGFGQGGGGGAGGYRSNVTGQSSGGNSSAEDALFLSPNNNYQVLVGAGGTGAVRGVRGGNGFDSLFGSISSLGGGGGGSTDAAGQVQGLTGGSGGGGSITGASGAGTAAQGLAGGSGVNGRGAGGGGAGQTGVSPVTFVGGAGGNGLSSNITGSSVTRAGGGGGGTFESQGGSAPGGAGGGGAGGTNSVGTAATANTGGGGGGGAQTGSGEFAGAAGGSGVVIIRYLTP
jgi:hypothetical protein